MRGWISIVAVSAVLAAGLVTGRAAADSTTAAPTWSDPPAKPIAAAPVRTAAATGPACTAQVWASLASGCSAQGRPVRVIALTQR